MVKGTGIGEDGGKGKGLMVSTVDSLGAARDFKGLSVGVNRGGKVWDAQAGKFLNILTLLM